MTAKEALAMPADPYEASYMWRVCSADSFAIVWELVDPITRNLVYVRNTPGDALFIRNNIASHIDTLQQSAWHKLKADSFSYTKVDWHYGTKSELLQWLKAVLEEL